jgi:hypothetical protein
LLKLQHHSLRLLLPLPRHLQEQVLPLPPLLL